MEITQNLLKEVAIEKTLLYSEGQLFEEEEKKREDQEAVEKAYLKGREEGEILGYEKGQKEFMQLSPLLHAIAHKLLERKKEIVIEAKREIIEFALLVAEKILRSELSQKEKFAKLIDSYLTCDASNFHKESVKVFLSPVDLLMLQTHFNETSYMSGKIEEITFLPDPQLQRGDFRIVTQSAILNATLSRQLDDLRSKVLQP